MFLNTNRKRRINQEDCACMFALYKTNEALGTVGHIPNAEGALSKYINLLEDHYMTIANVDFEHLNSSFDCDTAFEFYKIAKDEFPNAVD